MSPTIFHIYEGWGIQAYGVCIAIGAVLATYLMIKDPRKVLAKEQIYNLFSWCVIVATLGGWLLSVIATRPTTIDDLFSAGLSVLGSILALLIFLFFYFRSLKIPVLTGLDFSAPYAPLVQAFGRIGCFFAGCCHGIETSLPWAVVYTNPESRAPLCVGLHPSQLYSAALLVLIFFTLRWVSRKRHTPGTIIALYLCLAGLERFVTDFFRSDHGSIHQVIAFSISFLAGMWLLFNYERKSIHPR